MIAHGQPPPLPFSPTAPLNDPELIGHMVKISVRIANMARGLNANEWINERGPDVEDELLLNLRAELTRTIEDVDRALERAHRTRDP